MAFKIRSKVGLQQVLFNDKGFFFFKFDEASAYREIVETGPWHFRDRLMVLQQWYRQMELEKVGMTKVPLWIQIYNIHLDYWNAQGHSDIASAVGRTLYADKLTETSKRLGSARVCENVELKFTKGKSADLVIKYPWRPLKCCKSQTFGHADYTVNVNAGPKHVNKVWIVKDGKGLFLLEALVRSE